MIDYELKEIGGIFKLLQMKYGKQDMEILKDFEDFYSRWICCAHARVFINYLLST